MMGLSTARLIGYAVAALAVIGLVTMVLGWRTERNELRTWQAGVLTATREASANPKLNKRDVVAQIRELGTSIAALKQGITKQNAAVNALAAESDRQKAAASKASEAAQERASKAEATASRLAASAKAPSNPKGPCEPSKTVKDTWQ